MLRFLFPRFFGQYKEGGLVVGRFTFTSAGTTWAKTGGSSVSAQDHHPFFATLTRNSSGVNTLAFTPVKKATIWVAALDAAGSTVATQRVFQVRTPNVSAGSCIIVIGDTAVPTLADPADQSILTFCAYVDQ